MPRTLLRCKISLCISFFHLLACLSPVYFFLPVFLYRTLSLSSSLHLISSSRSYRLLVCLLISLLHSALVSSLGLVNSLLSFLAGFHVFESLKSDKEQIWQLLPPYNHRNSHNTFSIVEIWPAISYLHSCSGRLKGE